MKRPVTIIEARPNSVAAQLRAMWAYRSFYSFLVRELGLKKFRDTLLGFWWLIIRPLLPTVIAVVAFTFVRPVESEGLPYPVFYLAGFSSWVLFQSLMNFTPRSLLWMSGLMRKTYFPRLLVPLASVGPPLIELAVVAALLVGALGLYLIAHDTLYLRTDVGLLLTPVLLMMALLFGLSLGMIASIAALFVRDIVFSVSYLAQMFMFLSPVLYPMSAIPPEFRTVMLVLNPMAAIVEGTRWSLTGAGEVNALALLYACAVILLVFTFSIALFIRAEPHLGDAL